MRGEAELSGPDYLAVVADEAAGRGQPYADEFRRMILDAALGDQRSDALLVSEAIASRLLHKQEASPVSIVYSAFLAASEQGDREAADEVLKTGLALLAKWSDWLAATSEAEDD